MINIDDLILYENENSTLDFKKIMYRKENFQELLLDVLSFANSHTLGDKYIIFGVKHTPSNERDLVGIDETSFGDQSTYQQLINANIEPDIDLECFIHTLNDKKFGVFKIAKPTDRPYVLKKNYNELKTGTALIRKGTLRMPLSRSDYDQIYADRHQENGFKGTIQFSLSNDANNVLTVKQVEELRSERARAKIINIISKKKKDIENNNLLALIPKIPSTLGYFSGVPYEDRSIEELEKNLKSVEETYYEDDMYELCSKWSEKVNFTLLNKGNSYLEDCTVQLLFPKLEGMFLLDRIYNEPQRQSPILSPEIAIAMANNTPYENLHYPSFSEQGEYYSFESNIGDLKHNLVAEVFNVPFRIVFFSIPNKEDFIVKIKIFGKNLIEPIEEELKITLSHS